MFDESEHLGFIRRVTERRASGFATVTEWSKGHRPSYYRARKHDWVQEIAAKLGWEIQERLPVGYWTKERCHEEAKRFGSLKEWAAHSQSSYRTAQENNWHQESATELGWTFKKHKPPGFWNYENCTAEASKYKSLTDWNKGCPGGYRQAFKKGWHLTIADELGLKAQKGKPNGFWSYAKCLATAKKYHQPTAWRTASPGSYSKSREKGWLPVINEIVWPEPSSQDMIRRNKSGATGTRLSWTLEKCSKMAAKYPSEILWRGSTSYLIATKNGWHDQIVAEVFFDKA